MSMSVEALSPDHNALVLAELGEAERLACAYAPRSLRPVYQAVFALDATLRRVSLGAREPLPAQLRLAWWREALAALPARRDHPILAALADTWRTDTAALVALVDAWEEIAVGDGVAEAAAEQVAGPRASAFAKCADESAALALPAARCWTLVALADRASNDQERARMLDRARHVELLRMPRKLRPLAVLAGLAQRAGRRGGSDLLGDRLSPLAAIRLGILGR